MELQVLKFDDFNFSSKKYYLDQRDDIYFVIKTISTDIGHIQCFKGEQFYHNDWEIRCYQSDDSEIRLMNYSQTGFIFSRHCHVRLEFRGCDVLKLVPHQYQNQALWLDKMLINLPATEQILNYDSKFESQRYYVDEQNNIYFKLFVLTREIGSIRCYIQDNLDTSDLYFKCVQTNYGEEIIIENDVRLGFMFPRQATVTLAYKGHQIVKLYPQRQQLIIFNQD